MLNGSGEVGVYDLDIWEDRTLTKTFKISGIASAVGYTAELMIRQAVDKPVLLALTSSPAAGLTITSDGTYLIIAVVITHTQAAALAAVIANGTWDFRVVNGSGIVKSYVEGKVIIHQVTTHA
jgi:hypothetical protein